MPEFWSKNKVKKEGTHRMDWQKGPFLNLIQKCILVRIGLRMIKARGCKQRFQSDLSGIPGTHYFAILLYSIYLSLIHI